MATTGGKADMDRIGLFQEMGYVSIGAPYVPPSSMQFNTDATKGKQMYGPGSKERGATKDGYFAKFDRVFEAEGYTDPVHMRRVQKIKDAEKNVGKAWVPVNALKKPSGVGSNYGTFSGPIQALSAQRASAPPYKSPGKNVICNPPKKGTGYGYVNVTIGKSHQYMSEPYSREDELDKKSREEGRRLMKGSAFKAGAHGKDYFDPNTFKTDKPDQATFKESERHGMSEKMFKPSNPGKKPGGMCAGTFNAWPTHAEEKYLGPQHATLVKEVVNSSGKKFVPSSGPRPYPVSSVLEVMVHNHVTPVNYKSVTTVY